ncbi:MAG: molybdopterin molybdotransferase MoeA [Rhodospirillales bacterium]|nr:molybdopterin molybdotransferase MoeA [Rhodospirillales bacterium]
MISVEEARQRVLAGIGPVPDEQIGIAQAVGRVLAQDVRARVSHPPVAVSSMDGYAVRATDVATVPAELALIGESAAGRAFPGSLNPGQAVRIFTGAPMPYGADAVVMQENTRKGEGTVTILESVRAGHFVRPAGLDFAVGDAPLKAGRRLGARDVGLIAAMNVPWIMVKRPPRVAILSTGDELVMPGEPIGPSQIIGSNGLALAAFVTAMGGEATILGTALDSEESLRAMTAGARGADLLVTSGGASVGDYDLVQSALDDIGLRVDFYKVAMRPGKPLMFGSIGEVPVLGVPGNPVSALVCAYMFLGPALRKMVGLPAEVGTVPAILGRDLGANDRRQDHLRATLSHRADGALVATPFDRQDSAMMAGLALADCLVVRAAFAPAARAGEPVDVIPLSEGR